MARHSKHRRKRAPIETESSAASAPTLPIPTGDAWQDRPSVAPGTILDGRYRLVRRISAGGMGEVWAGVHLALGHEVALKILRREVAADHEHRARLRREADLLTRLRTDCIARILDYFIDRSYGPIIVLELLRGSNLACLATSQTWSVEETIALGIDLTSAMVQLDGASVIHRDIKPGNVILASQPDGTTRPIIVDFGVSRQLQPPGDDAAMTTLTGADSGVGTLQYMAPEQLLGARRATHQSDLYSLGAVLYRMVTGEYVFPGLDGAALARAKLTSESPRLATGRSDPLARGLEEVVCKALQRDPALRYKNAAEMRQDLLALRKAPQESARFATSWLRGLRFAEICLVLAVGGVIGYAAGKVGLLARGAPAAPMGTFIEQREATR